MEQMFPLPSCGELPTLVAGDLPPATPTFTGEVHIAVARTEALVDSLLNDSIHPGKCSESRHRLVNFTKRTWPCDHTWNEKLSTLDERFMTKGSWNQTLCVLLCLAPFRCRAGLEGTPALPNAAVACLFLLAWSAPLSEKPTRRAANSWWASTRGLSRLGLLWSSEAFYILICVFWWICIHIPRGSKVEKSFSRLESRPSPIQMSFVIRSTTHRHPPQLPCLKCRFLHLLN